MEGFGCQAHYCHVGLEVGSRSHAKLEDASRVAMMALVTHVEGSVEEEEDDGETTE